MLYPLSYGDPLEQSAILPVFSTFGPCGMRTMKVIPLYGITVCCKLDGRVRCEYSSLAINAGSLQ